MANQWIIAGCCAVLALLLSACGNSEQPAASQPQASAPAKAAPEPAQAGNPLADMVKAVPAATGEHPVELRFEIAKRPLLGESFDINLNILTLVDASGLELKVSGSPNVSVAAGKESNFGALKTGESVRHTLQVRAAAAGISALDVQIVAMVDGRPSTANFAIPVAVADTSKPADTTSK